MGPKPLPLQTKFVAFRIHLRTFEVNPYFLDNEYTSFSFIVEEMYPGYARIVEKQQKKNFLFFK